MRDDFDAVVAGRFKVLDEVPVPDTWSQVQFKVLDQLPVQFVEDDATMIDLETPIPTGDRQKESKRVVVAGLMAAAAAAVLVAVLAPWSRNDPEVMTPADTAAASSNELVVRPLAPPIECELNLCPWSPELTAQALELSSPASRASNVAVSPDGTVVALDPTAGTLTWYENEPRVVPLTAELARRVDETFLMAIGPHDIAYIGIRGYFVAVAPSGAEITRVAWTTNQPPFIATAAGLIEMRSRWPAPNAAPDMPWVNLDGNPITDSRPYPTAKSTEGGIEVHFGERKWLLANEPGIRPVPLDVLPRSDGGVVIVFDTWHLGQHQPANVDEDAQAINLLELSPDGSIERYFVDTPLPPVVLPDGSLIVAHDLQLVRLTPPT